MCRDAQYSLGLCYYNGQGVIQDYQQAVYWFQKAAEQWNPYAQYYLALCFVKGQGVIQDYKQAAYWYQSTNMAISMSVETINANSSLQNGSNYSSAFFKPQPNLSNSNNNDSPKSGLQKLKRFFKK